MPTQTARELASRMSCTKDAFKISDRIHRGVIPENEIRLLRIEFHCLISNEKDLPLCLRVPVPNLPKLNLKFSCSQMKEMVPEISLRNGLCLNPGLRSRHLRTAAQMADVITVHGM